ncbi:cilia- and flagella-associated protein 161-like [Convolutriloba macropyga]|uniref:cilia- and flagella-associated protein 161-like n=1 Tax=Convolutriloba macropyga TaxID=536237 RepID=UPI003F52612F
MNIFTEKTLVANWFEDRILQEDKIKEYLDKRERGELQSQKNASLSTAMLNSTKLSASTDGWVKIGDNVSFVNPHLFYDKTLALTFAGETATALDFTSPQVRNTFVIFPTDGSKEGDKLRYGQSFAIATHPSIGASPQFLESDFGGLLNTKKSRTQPMKFTDTPCYGATWKVICFDPQLRLETEGMPVPANEPIILVHCKTNNNLSYLQAMTVATPFGTGQEVTARTELDSHNAEQITNHWKIVTGS